MKQEPIRTWWGNVEVGDMVMFRDAYSNRTVTVLGQDPEVSAYLLVVDDLGTKQSVHNCFCNPAI